MYCGCSSCCTAPPTLGSASNACAAASSNPASATARAHRIVTECLNQPLIFSHIVSALFARKEMNDGPGAERACQRDRDDGPQRQPGLVRGFCRGRPGY